MSKSLGSRNKINTVKAVFNGLENIFDAKKIARDRGKELKDMWG